MSEPTLQERINALPPTGGTIVLPAGATVLREPLNLRGRWGLTLAGDGPGSVIIGALPDTTPTGTPLIDLTGVQYLNLRNFRLKTHEGTRAGVGLLFGREVYRKWSGDVCIDNVVVEGSYTVANVYILGTELGEMRSVRLRNEQPAGRALWSGSYNSAGVRALGPLHAGEQGVSNAHWTFSNCRFGVYAEDPQAVCVQLEPWAISYQFTGCCLSLKKPGRAGILIGDAAHPERLVQYVGLQNCSLEVYAARAGIEFAGDAEHVALPGTRIYCRGQPLALGLARVGLDAAGCGLLTRFGED